MTVCVALVAAVGQGAMKELKELDLSFSGVTARMLEGLGPGKGALRALALRKLYGNKELKEERCTALLDAGTRGRCSSSQK